MDKLSVFLKWLPMIGQGMSTVQKIKTAKGSEKLDIVVQNIEDNITILEGSLGKELINELAVREALRTTISAVKNLHNAIEFAKLAIASTK